MRKKKITENKTLGNSFPFSCRFIFNFGSGCEDLLKVVKMILFPIYWYNNLCRDTLHQVNAFQLHSLLIAQHDDVAATTMTIPTPATTTDWGAGWTRKKYQQNRKTERKLRKLIRRFRNFVVLSSTRYFCSQSKLYFWALCTCCAVVV